MRRYEWKITSHGPQLWDLEEECWVLWYGVGAIGITEHVVAEIDAALNPTWGAADEYLLALKEDLSEARYNARILAHAYESDTRPPQRVVKQSLKYPVNTDEIAE